MQVEGNYAYVAAKESGLLVFDITNPASPLLISSYPTPSATNVHIKGSYAYIADSTGLIILNIETPSNPIFVSSYNTTYSARHTFVTADHKAFLSGTPAFSILDVTPEVPKATTGSVSGITYTGAEFSGNVTSDGNGNATARGFCWSTSPDPLITDSHIVNGSGEGAFTSLISGLIPGTTYYVRAYAQNSVGTGYGNTVTFTTAQYLAPSVITDSASGITLTGAVINGRVNANNQLTTVTFEYGTTTAYGQSIEAVPATVSGISETAVSADLNGLQPATTYHFRVKAVNTTGTSFGSDMFFTTTGGIPQVKTDSPSDITNNSAVFHGTVNPNNLLTTVTFEYGTTASYGSVVTAQPGTLNGTDTFSVSSPVSDLIADTLYNFRITGVNASGRVYGANMFFKTASGKLPRVSTASVSDITQTAVKSGGNVISAGDSSVILRGVCWSLAPNPAINGFHTENGRGTGSFTSEINNLIPGQTYYIRAYAQNSFGISYGENIKVTTFNENSDLQIVSPLNGDTVSGMVKITAFSSEAVAEVKYYINGELFKTVKSDDSSESRTPSLIFDNNEFNIQDTAVLFIDKKKSLKKISSTGDIRNVFTKDIKTENIVFAKNRIVYIDLCESIILNDCKKYRYLKADLMNGKIIGINEIPVIFPVHPGKFFLSYNRKSGNYMININKSHTERDTLAFLRKKPEKIIPLPVDFINTGCRAGFRYAEERRVQDFMSRYTVEWNTLTHPDGLCRIKVQSADKENRVISDYSEVFIRNLRIYLSAARKEVKGYTFRAHVAELNFIVKNINKQEISHFIVYRREGDGKYESVSKLSSSGLPDETLSYYDSKINKDNSYTYKVIAYDSSDKVLSESEEVTI